MREPEWSTTPSALSTPTPSVTGRTKLVRCSSGREDDAGVEHGLGRGAHGDVEHGREDAAVDRAERAVLLFARLVLEDHAARQHVGAAQTQELGDGRHRDEPGGEAVEELEPGQRVGAGGCLGRVVPGDRAGTGFSACGHARLQSVALRYRL